VRQQDQALSGKGERRVQRVSNKRGAGEPIIRPPFPKRRRGKRIDDRLFEFTEFGGRWDSLIDSLIVDLEYESPSGDKFRAALLEKIIEAETIASESEAASAGDTPALRKTEFQVELRHRLRADPSNEVRREALALLTNAQLRETMQQSEGTGDA
jgi:hypothetical protein